MYNTKPKISAVMCTFKRFKCVERTMNCFLQQTYQNKELIIFNTDEENPYLWNEKISMLGINIINCSIDKLTNQPYTNVGAIRRDALEYATGDYVVTWDDDDIFLPWFMQQAMDRMEDSGMPSFKPEKSFFYSGNNLRLVRNTLEASVVADIKKVREYGYLLETGKEGLAWYTKMRDNKELNELDTHYLPSYCFNWNDGNEMNAPHKQSGNINHPDNFEHHKAASLDGVNGRHLLIYDDLTMEDFVYYPYYQYLYNNEDQFPQELVDKYLYP